MRRRAHRVAVLVFPPVSVFETAVACEVVGLDRRDARVPPYQLRLGPLYRWGWARLAPPRFVTNGGGGLTFDTPYRLESLRWADTIVLPGWPEPGRAVVPDAVVAELRRAHRRGARLASLCSGAFILA